MRSWLRKLRTKPVLFGFGGLVLGVLFAGTFFYTVETTDTPEFCSGCHVMDSVFGSFSESNHAQLDCNDCHAPQDTYATKVAFKARTGAGHIYMNTLGVDDIPDVLHATTDSVDVINDNCIRCHQPTVRDVAHDAKEGCADCHRAVPHGRGAHRPDDWHEPMHPEASR